MYDITVLHQRIIIFFENTVSAYQETKGNVTLSVKITIIMSESLRILLYRACMFSISFCTRSLAPRLWSFVETKKGKEGKGKRTIEEYRVELSANICHSCAGIFATRFSPLPCPLLGLLPFRGSIRRWKIANRFGLADDFWTKKTGGSVETFQAFLAVAFSFSSRSLVLLTRNVFLFSISSRKIY